MLIFPDLSQIEYRLIAHDTQEPKLIRAFREGRDIHDETCRDIILGRLPKDKKERKKYGKTPNYGEIYGVGVAKLAFMAGVTYQEAKEFKRKMKGRYSYADEYKNNIIDQLESGGIIRFLNIFGRVRYVSLSDFYGDNQREKVRNALREIFNWKFQSSAHDVYKIWTMECMEQINDRQVLIINDVHDEFVLDVPDSKVKKVLDKVGYVSNNLNELILERFGVKMRVPILAEIEMGRSWK